MDDTETVYDSNAQKIVVFYQDEANSDYGTAIVGTVSGTSISFGTAVVFESAAIAETAATYDSNAQKVVIAYRDGGNSNKGTLAVGTVSGTSISFGTPVVFETGATYKVSTTYDSNAQRVVVAYRDNNDSLNGKAAVFRNAYTSTNLTAENYIGMSGGVVNSITPTLGSSTVFESAEVKVNDNYTFVAYDSNSNRIVVAYRDTGNSNYGTAIVGTVSGTSISFGTPVVFESATTKKPAAQFDSNSNKIVISYADGGNSDHGTAVVGTVNSSNNSISFGTPAVFETTATELNSLSFDSSSNKLVLAFKDNSGPDGDEQRGRSVVGTVSGTNISFGSPTAFIDDTLSSVTPVFDSNANKTVVVFREVIFDGSSAGVARVGTVSGTSISYGTKATFSVGDINGPLTATFDSFNNKVCVFYKEESNDSFVVVGTVSGTNISFGTPVLLSVGSAAKPSEGFSSTFDTETNLCIFTYKNDDNKGVYTSVSISGTTATQGDVVIFDDGGGDSTGLAYDLNAKKSVVGYKDNGNSNYGTAVVFSAGETTRAEVASGSNAVIDIGCAISTNQLSLTAGQKYYVQTDGTLGLTAADPSVFAGTAVSATKLIVKG